jgi:hypothetical protein
MIAAAKPILELMEREKNDTIEISSEYVVQLK